MLQQPLHLAAICSRQAVKRPAAALAATAQLQQMAALQAVQLLLMVPLAFTS
jgi:hypothetical protein